MEEREAKLGVPDGFELPDLTGTLDGIAVAAVTDRQLDATYYDTGDLRLIREGITLRNRVDTASGASEWTVKFPISGTSGLLVRDEINVAAPPGTPPAELVGLVRAHARTAALAPVARLLTQRGAVELASSGGSTRLAEIDQDVVTVIDGGGQTVDRFGEIEIELAAAAPPELLDAVVTRLRRAGAGVPDATPKLVRALGRRAVEAPDLVPVGVGAAPTGADVLRAALTAAVRRVIDHDRVIRLDTDPEGVHQARVGLRRLRSDLRTFRPLVDRSWSEPLRDEMRWLGAELGAVRDRDVMLARLRNATATLPAVDQEAAGAMLAKIERQRDAAQRALLTTIDSERYVALLDRLVDAATQPRLLPGAESPASEVVPALAARPWRRLRRAVKALSDHPTDEELHQLRIAVKRARYAADAAAPVAGGEAEKYTKRLAALQDVLGDLHDTAVAEAWLRDAATGATRAQALAAGHLIGIERAEAQRCREAWPTAWRAASRRRHTRWLSRP